jgi:hypothetical protein
MEYLIHQRCHLVKKKILCKNNIGIISKLKIKFDYENYYNYNNITVIYKLQPYISSIKKLTKH